MAPAYRNPFLTSSSSRPRSWKWFALSCLPFLVTSAVIPQLIQLKSLIFLVHFDTYSVLSFCHTPPNQKPLGRHPCNRGHLFTSRFHSARKAKFCLTTMPSEQHRLPSFSCLLTCIHDCLLVVLVSSQTTEAPNRRFPRFSTWEPQQVYQGGDCARQSDGRLILLVVDCEAGESLSGLHPNLLQNEVILT